MRLVFSIVGSSLGGCTSQGERGLFALHRAEEKGKNTREGWKASQAKIFYSSSILMFNLFKSAQNCILGF